MYADYLLKGLFIGLLACGGVRCSDSNAVWRIAIGLATGLVAAIGWSLIRLHRRGIRIGRSFDSSVTLAVLENPIVITMGMLLGLGAAASSIENNSIPLWLLPALVIAGVVHGTAMALNRQRLQSLTRINLGAVPAVIASTFGIVILRQWPELLNKDVGHILGTVVLIGLPAFYLLIFVARSGESEEDVATWCALLWAGLCLVGISPIPSLITAVGILVVYVALVLPRMPAWKAVLRGRAFAQLGQVSAALTELRTAVRHNPDNTQARSALWEIHRNLDAARLASEPEIAVHVDPYFCLDRVRAILTEPPTIAQLSEANHLLYLIETREPQLHATATYWRAVAATHQHDIESAAKHLNAILEPSNWKPNDSDRRSILFHAWQLALILHPKLETLVGQAQLMKPGRRLEAIDTVERVLADAPEDSTAWTLKRILYPQLTNDDVAGIGGHQLDAGYLEQLGLASMKNAHEVERGADYLMMAARLAPADAPRLYWQAAQALEQHGRAIAAGQARERGLQAGQATGSAQLTEESRRAYFAMVKKSAEDALTRGDRDSAAQLYQTYSEYDRSGFETVRLLSELHEKRGDALAALHATARALVYLPKDADLLARRDRCLYTIKPQDLRRAPESVRSAVDSDYCLATAKQFIDLRDADTGLLDWARHLAELASVLRPGDFQSRLLIARASLRLGERDRATQLLEDIREQRPKKFAHAVEEGAWFSAIRILGDLYLNDYDRPDLAVSCFEDFRASDRSGADTLYKIGLGYERQGERARAAKFYQEVIGFEGHPLAFDAKEALQRVRQN